MRNNLIKKNISIYVCNSYIVPVIISYRGITADFIVISIIITFNTKNYI